MRAVVTCGPGYEPLDEVRRLTNFSTGELGVILANRLAQAGCEVICFKGVAATSPLRLEGPRLMPFSTNDNLLAGLEAVEAREEIAAVFHAAALCDYRVKSVRTSDGSEIAARKIPSREGELTVTLEPVSKLIGRLRELFPRSRIAGWKYELGGNRAELLVAAERQLSESATDACVLNGAAYGSGFGVFQRNKLLAHCAEKTELSDWLVRWLE